MAAERAGRRMIERRQSIFICGPFRVE